MDKFTDEQPLEEAVLNIHEEGSDEEGSLFEEVAFDDPMMPMHHGHCHHHHHGGGDTEEDESEGNAG